MTELKDLNPHPRDERIQQDPNFLHNHIYQIDKETNHGYISGTSFIRQFFGKFDPKKIIKKNYDNWQRNKDVRYHGKTPEEIEKQWQKKGKDTSQLGTFMHDLIEKYYNNEKILDYSLEWVYFLDFDKDHNYLTPYRTEMMIFTEDYKLVGTCDALFKDGDEYVLMDWKRKPAEKYKGKIFNNAKYPINHIPDNSYWQDCLQLNLYKYILESKYRLKIKKMKLVLLHPKNSQYETFDVPELGNEIKSMLKERELEIK